jgi:hypothetical protein
VKHYVECGDAVCGNRLGQLTQLPFEQVIGQLTRMTADEILFTIRRRTPGMQVRPDLAPSRREQGPQHSR